MEKSYYNILVKSNTHTNKYYLFNTWKGCLVELDENKAIAYEKNSFDVFDKKELDELLRLGFLTCCKNEFEQVVEENRKALQKKREKFAVCISPTTRCNARCSYCFEKEIVPQTMSLAQADKIVDWIVAESNGCRISIRWFGGEPLLCGNIITYICDSLNKKGVTFTSSMISNGFLIDKHIEDIVNRWQVKTIQVTIDGLYEEYNKIKKFTTSEDAFRKVIDNIHLLAREEISIAIRVNFDPKNIDKTLFLIDWFKNEFINENKVTLYCNHLMGDDYSLPIELPLNPYVLIFEKLAKLNYIKTLKGFRISRRYQYCSYWDEKFYNIAPDGSCYKCEHDIGKNGEYIYDKIGEEYFGCKSLGEEYLDECKTCKCFPICAGGCVAERKRNIYAGCLQIVNSLDKVVAIWAENL